MKTNSRQPPAAPKELVEHAHQRTTAFEIKLDRAMAEIERDIANNDGLYPFNSGRLSQAELCRRAGVDKKSLQGARHVGTTREKVKKWLDRVGIKVIQGKKDVRKTVVDRVDVWKEAHRQVAQDRHLAQLRLEGALERLRIVETENTMLREKLSHLSEGRIVGLPRRQ
jgi:hypothetical protein